jgi:hypothetical protein
MSLDVFSEKKGVEMVLSIDFFAEPFWTVVKLFFPALPGQPDRIPA